MTQQTCWPEVRESKFLLAVQEMAMFKLGDPMKETSGIAGIVPGFDRGTGQFTIDGILNDSAAHEAGLLPDDQIVTIDGELVSRRSTMADVFNLLRGDEGVPLSLKVGCNGIAFSTTITRGPKPEGKPKFFRRNKP
jgi:C-terminal processing protease CtpA/Prc